MLRGTAAIDPAFTVGPVRRNTFGSFVEHLGRSVYTGIHDPEHPTANSDGFRQDVIDLVRELGISTVRYPGGNFVSAYRWQDGIGPVEHRPRRLDLAWHSTEPNTVGLDEFIRWCQAAAVEPMMAVNLGTAGVLDAVDVLEYSNVLKGTDLSDLRRANGAEDPHRIKLWCLGNEMDGPWQTGHKTAYEYGRLAAETARAMRQVDPDLTLVACGSSGRDLPTFGSWEQTVLTEAYDQVDLISTHAYYHEADGDLPSFLASAVDMDRFIEEVVATADAVRAAGKHTKRINISFDEWNVWYIDRAESQPPSGADWPVAPVLLEDRYSVADAVVVGNLLMALLRHSDRVHAASLAQLVNVIAPIMTEPGGRAWKQTTFHPFALTSRHARGEVLHTVVSAPSVETAKHGETLLLDVVATYDADSGELVLFAVNRSVDSELTLKVDVGRFGDLHVAEAVSMASTDHHKPGAERWFATADDDTSVVPAANQSAEIIRGTVSAVLPAVSWSMLRLSRA